MSAASNTSISSAEVIAASQHPVHQRVSAILVSHNGARWLPEVVAAISSQVRAPDFLFAIDTGSTDGSAELLRNSRIDVLEAERDAGFGDAVAHAVSQLPPTQEIITESGEVVAHEIEWLWLLHDDCAPAPEALEQLLAAVAERPNVGVAGPKILGWHDRSHLLEIGVTIAHNGARWTGLERNERDQGQHDGDGAIPVLAVSTAGALIRRDLFEEIGGFDPNLPLFRDDVDFGMRAHMAGYTVMCVTSAKLFHAEAAATERRSIDVAGGSFHRPHLLDRRHAAFVLLANLPLWTLPWITLRIFASSSIRAMGYLLAKLPGYALDEIVAVALLFTRLDRLRSARRARRKKRLLPARVIRPLLAPWSDQIKLGALRVRDLLLRRVESVPTPVVGNVFAESDDSFEGDLLAPSHNKIWRQTITRPLFIACAPLFILSLIASRARFGELAGGALAKVGDSAIELFQTYGQSWHPLGVGSGQSSHPFTPLLAIFSFISGGDPALFVTLISLLAPVLALLSMYLFLRRSGAGRWISAAAGALYGTSVTLITSVTVGYLSTTLLLILLPLVGLVIRPLLPNSSNQSLEIQELSWRRTSLITLMITICTALSFQIFLALTLYLVFHTFYLWRTGATKEIVRTQASKYALIVFGSYCSLAPWSIANTIHPGELFADQGLPLTFTSPVHVLLDNLQPAQSVPRYAVGICLLMGIVGIFSHRAFADSLVILSSLVMATFLNAIAVSAHGDSSPARIWPGGFLALAMFFSARAFANLSQGRIKRLRESPLGRAHFATALVSVFAIYSIATNLFWWVSGAGEAPVKSINSTVLPAFISTATENPDRPKTLIIRAERDAATQRYGYVVLRNRDVRMEELANLPKEVSVLTKSVSEILAGAGDSPASILAQFGIRYLYLENGRANNALARKIDGIGGLTRLSATSDGVLWEVSGLTSRIRFISTSKGDNDNQAIEVTSELVGAEFDVAGSGKVQLAEMYDGRWRALHGGKVLLPNKSELGLTEFTIPDAGRVVLFHDGTIHRAGISLQVAALGLLIFLALPRGRRQSELSDEEVS